MLRGGRAVARRSGGCWSPRRASAAGMCSPVPVGLPRRAVPAPGSSGMPKGGRGRWLEASPPTPVLSLRVEEAVGSETTLERSELSLS